VQTKSATLGHLLLKELLAVGEENINCSVDSTGARNGVTELLMWTKAKAC